MPTHQRLEGGCYVHHHQPVPPLHHPGCDAGMTAIIGGEGLIGAMLKPGAFLSIDDFAGDSYVLAITEEVATMMKTSAKPEERIHATGYAVIIPEGNGYKLAVRQSDGFELSTYLIANLWSVH